MSIDFYVRVFVRVHTSAQASKKSATKMAYVLQSKGCDAWELQRVGQMVTKGNCTKWMPGMAPVVGQT